MKELISDSCCSDRQHSLSRREFIRLVGLVSLACTADGLLRADEVSKVKYYGAFAELPVGAVKPGGWIKKWLERQADGLSGHPENMAYPYDTCMYAGVIPPPPSPHGEDWWAYEQSGYFFDATARLNRLIDSPVVKARHQANLDFILKNSTERGYGASTWAWPNAVAGRALLADYSTTGDTNIVSLMARYLGTNPTQGTRAGVNAEEAAYLYGATGDPQLLAYLQQIYKTIKGPGANLNPDRISSPELFKAHGVSAAEFMKVYPLTYLYTGNPEALDLTRRAYEKIVADNLMADGGIVSDESLGWPTFDALHESCDISDWSWSMGYCLMATGDAKWADLIERTIFNALPGAVSKDFKQLQYFSDVNQILSTSRSNHGPFSCVRMSYRAAHDTECCSGNINRAMPNFVIRQWMKTTNDGLAAILYGPSEVTTKLKGHSVTVTQETDYPFRETIAFRVRTATPVTFGFQLRIPGWCKSATIAINGQPFQGTVDPGTFVTVSREFKDGDVIELKLPMEVRTEEWFEKQSVVLLRGPLVFSVKIEEKGVELMKDSPDAANQLNDNFIKGFPALEFYPKSEWRYGIGPDLKSSLEQIKVVESPMTDNPFVASQVPVHLELPLRHLPNWQTRWEAEPPLDAQGKIQVVKTPGALPSDPEKAGAEAATVQQMIPYGATHLRLTTLPVVA